MRCYLYTGGQWSTIDNPIRPEHTLKNYGFNVDNPVKEIEHWGIAFELYARNPEKLSPKRQQTEFPYDFHCLVKFSYRTAYQVWIPDLADMLQFLKEIEPAKDLNVDYLIEKSLGVLAAFEHTLEHSLHIRVENEK